MELYTITKTRKYVLTNEGLEELKQEYNKGYSQRKIAEKFNVNVTTVIGWFKEEKIPTRKRKYKINENYFENIDSNEKAYWLGFFSADGYVHEERGELTLELQEKDREHLEKFKNAINSNKPLMTILCGENKQFIHYRFVIRCRKMVNDLKKYNVYQRKSLTFIPPSNLEEKYLPYWIIGYMDGDGCIADAKGRVRISFTGTKATLEFIKNYLKSSNIIRLEHRCNNTYQFSPEVDKCESFLKQYSYNNIPYALNRKKKRYASIVQ